MTQHPASVAYVDGMRVWQSFGTYVHVLTGNFSHLFVPEYCTMQCMMRLPTGDDLIEHVVRSWMVDFVVKQMSAAGRLLPFVRPMDRPHLNIYIWAFLTFDLCILHGPII